MHLDSGGHFLPIPLEFLVCLSDISETQNLLLPGVFLQAQNVRKPVFGRGYTAPRFLSPLFWSSLRPWIWRVSDSFLRQSCLVSLSTNVTSALEIFFKRNAP